VSREEQIQALRRQLRDIERQLGGRTHPVSGWGREHAGSHTGQQVVSTGHEVINQLLPEGGLRRGGLVEWIQGGGPGSGAASVALMVAAGVAKTEAETGQVVVIDPDGGFYPAAAVPLGIDVAKLLVVRTGTEQEWQWAVEQVMRCRGVVATVTWAGQVDERACRRWQLACERGGGVGLLVRPDSVIGESSWAQVRVLVEGVACHEQQRERRWRARVLKGGVALGDGPLREVEWEWGDETGGLRLVSGLECAETVGVASTG